MNKKTETSLNVIEKMCDLAIAGIEEFRQDCRGKSDKKDIMFLTDMIMCHVKLIMNSKDDAYMNYLIPKKRKK